MKTNADRKQTKCIRRSDFWHVTPGEVVLLEGAEETHFDRAQVPSEIANAFQKMWELAGFSCPPRLEFVRTLHGTGGLYVNGLIVVGIADAEEIARSIWTEWGDRVKERARQICQNPWLSSTEVYEFVRVAVQGRIVAHELGHAMRDDLAEPTPFDDEEAAADFLAGKLDALRGKDRELGSLIFYAIGCEGLLCTHATPCGRAHAYVTGYERGLGTSEERRPSA